MFKLTGEVGQKPVGQLKHRNCGLNSLDLCIVIRIPVRQVEKAVKFSRCWLFRAGISFEWVDIERKSPRSKSCRNLFPRFREMFRVWPRSPHNKWEQQILCRLRQPLKRLNFRHARMEDWTVGLSSQHPEFLLRQPESHSHSRKRYLEYISKLLSSLFVCNASQCSQFFSNCVHRHNYICR
ncbi:hypothetical protein D3C73_1049490 [compost metagenome]